ncbi:Co2+/Mg2+ efflux protein ApaG [Pseudoalteromonas luteoviolacea]|uniref:Protein ApaG n=1 Tax=Pseudoalteromonas luteoviolacea S4054 TaxID=1129367 RepID=A0A0F6A9X8_9GAMM|nr:Co2+/Mg2+ efflux protein ApaG [Pseudoalteromonas luteoviolacea]AOT07372.1 Co2+/Mg2+ efflux protein ApaG [Pseudoalteromonas luteoviolacea]AOT12287.1 Co2+/Mg2+ efflux protein ApaG [Pseudoalteromonas luteoviolacea]AOT17200.1 Co2+/Mg2+ efflux protein ApaG [Pseudoalteromonas luteoviolacea]KKE83002.1 cobalt transporter [Pseudoalteromonas luteoviolacea S4054]KZN72349.1 cobalt transporter [Pseudoalteromonas luteoviolacea S4047-1]
MTINSEIGNPIKVSVETFYVEAQSQPEKDKYVFAYTITLKNHSLCSAKLESRYWLITDANGKETEVEGEGVVGEQPTIRPGESYQYTSGAVLDTPVGTMEGYYLMRNEFGSEFKAPIQVFRLNRPDILH